MRNSLLLLVSQRREVMNKIKGSITISYRKRSHRYFFSSKEQAFDKIFKTAFRFFLLRKRKEDILFVFLQEEDIPLARNDTHHLIVKSMKLLSLYDLLIYQPNAPHRLTEKFKFSYFN